MKKHIVTSFFFFVLLSASVSPIFAQTTGIKLSPAIKEKEANAIKETLLRQVVAWNEGKIDGFMQGYWENDSLCFVTKKGVTKGYKQVADNYKRNYPDKTAMGTLYFEIQKVEILELETAFVIGKWSVIKTGESPEGAFTLMMKKINGQWKIILDHTS